MGFGGLRWERGVFLHIVSCSRHTAGRELAPPGDKDETLYSTSSLPFMRVSTSHLQEVSTFDVINSLKAFNPSNVNCQIYVDGPVDV